VVKEKNQFQIKKKAKRATSRKGKKKEGKI